MSIAVVSNTNTVVSNNNTVTALARKRSRSFYQKCRWQITAKHTCTYADGFAWSNSVKWRMVVWCAQNVRQKRQRFAWHQPCNNQIALSVHHFNGYTNKRTIKCTSHSFRITCDKSAVSLLESREQRSIKVINNNNKQRVRFEVCATQFGHCMKAFLACCCCCWFFLLESRLSK